MKIENVEKTSVEEVTQNLILKLSNSLEASDTKAILAKLRNSIGKPPEKLADAWKIVFESVPIEFLSRNGKATEEELAIITTLQLFALHQQGKTDSVNSINNEGSFKNIGDSLKRLRLESNPVATDRRFNAMITSSTFYELTEHLRYLFRLLKSKSNAKVNYAKLAKDLFWFQKGFNDQIRFSWAQAYYSKDKNETEKGE